MRNPLLKSAGLGACVALVATLAFLRFAPRDFPGWTPVGFWADTLFWPGVKVGVYVGEHWARSVTVGWVAGILTMTALGALLGLGLGLVCRQRFTPAT